MTDIHIKLADRGWILERCAAELASFAPGITVDTAAREGAELQYYVNYSAYRGRVSPVEVAFFTHAEEDADARRRFFEIAGQVDYCVCMSERYAQALRQSGVRNVHVIRPGVDLDAFRPRLRIGVIGRTYHTGRKGEALVEQVMDVEGIDWLFTGSGWPGPALDIPADRMAGFYNSLDYVLVPARYEGGPMSVLEGLACGRPIIASDVGWVEDFPHIPFRNGDAESLREVLRSLLAQRYALRAAVEDCGWDAWARGHVELFRTLLSEPDTLAPAGSLAASRTSVGRTGVVALATHGGEGRSKGGPSIRVPRTVRALRDIGVDAIEHGQELARPDLLHVFNVWPAASSGRLLDECRRADIATVFSPIFLNLATHGLYTRKVPQIYEDCRGEALEQRLGEVLRDLQGEPVLPLREPYPSYHEQVRSIVRSADHVVLLSEFERRCLDLLGAVEAGKTSVICNPVNADLFDGVDPDLFRARHGLDRYILQLGRIESRKNQLLVAEACRRLGATPVFVGHEGDPGYASLLRRVAGPAALFVPRLSQGDPLLASAIAGASVFCLPSWAEGAPLAALEAGAAGVPLVLSDQSGEREYFGEHAAYVNPADLPGTMAAIAAALEQSEDAEAGRRRSDHVRSRFSWSRHAQETAAVYARVLEARTPARSERRTGRDGRIFFDVTDWAYVGNKLTGTARVQHRQFHSLPAGLADRVVPVTWVRNTETFVMLTVDEMRGEAPIASYVSGRSVDHPSTLSASMIRPGDRLYSSSGAWIGNQGHFNALLDLKRSHGLPIGLVVHDLVRVDLAHLYDKASVATFSDRLAEMAGTVDCLMTYSKATEGSLAGFLRGRFQFPLASASFPLGEENLIDDGATPEAPAEMGLVDRPFMLIVGSIEPRKNHITVLQALKRLKAEFEPRTPLLAIAGADHLGTPALDHWLDANPDIAPLVVRIRNASDRELTWLYRNALLSLYPSFGEGWGLPVAESLQQGVVCLASSASSVPEAARGFGVLLDPYDPAAWADAIAERLRSPEILETERDRIVAGWHPQTWQQSVQSALEAVRSFSLRPRKEVEVPVDRLLDLSDEADRQLVRDCVVGGFHDFEATGVWQGEREASLVFPPLPGGSANRLSLRLNAFLKSGTKERPLSIRVNGIEIETLRIDERPTLYDLPLPESVRQGRPVNLSLVTDDLISPMAAGMGQDKRSLGVFVQAIGFFGPDQA